MWNSRKWSVKPKESLGGHLCWLDIQIEHPDRTVPEYTVMLEHATWSFHNIISCHIVTHNMQFFPVSPSHSHGISLVAGPVGEGWGGCPTLSHRTPWRCYRSLGLQPGICASPGASARPWILMQEVALMASALLPRLKSREWKENKSPSPKQTLSDTPCLYNLSLLAGACGIVPAGIPT